MPMCASGIPPTASGMELKIFPVYCIINVALSFGNVNTIFPINSHLKNVLRDLYILWYLAVKNQENVNQADILWTTIFHLSNPRLAKAVSFNRPEPSHTNTPSRWGDMALILL